jgi:hypothetical protein
MIQLFLALPLLILAQLLQPLPTHQNVLLIGDSEVRYVNWWGLKSVQQPNETVFVDSKPGTTIAQWNNGMWWDKHFFTFKSEMARYSNIDVVIVFLGTNNYNFTYLQPHQAILDTLKGSHAKCIWVGPTDVHIHGPRNPHIINGLLKKEVSSVCTYVDTESLHIPLVDGVHPTQAGAIKWMQEIWKVKSSL